MISQFFAATVCLSALTLVPLHAAEYFVTRAGEDSNTGRSRTNAFATIQQGVEALRPGDTLTIGPGQYHESVRRDGLGTNDVTTLIRADIPGTVILRGDVPAPDFTKVDGTRFVYVADFDFDGRIPAVNELDTLTIFPPRPNPAELEFYPGAFHFDAGAEKLYISTSDLRQPSEHAYSVSVIPTHGLYLSRARRVVIEGLSVTGFNALEQVHHRQHTHGGVWGMFLDNGKRCTIRDCRAFLNGWGIGLYSGAPTSGDNVIEQCTAWANRCVFGTGDMGGLTGFSVRRDVIRNSVAFRNAGYGVNIYGTGTDGGAYGEWQVPGNEPENRSRLINNRAWGNASADVKIKTGVKNFHTIERFTGGFPGSTRNIDHSLFKGARFTFTPGKDTIVLDQEADLDPNAEFADPANHDYRLQATSRFRGAAPDGSDRGPNPYKANVFFVKPNGNDNADGLSVSNAWRSLGRATRDLEAGDTLYVLPATYGGNLNIVSPGNGSEPVSIRGRGTEPVVIQGAVRVESTTPVQFQRIRFEQTITLRGDGEANGPPHSGGPTLPHSTSGATRGTSGASKPTAPPALTHSHAPALSFSHCHFTATNTALRATGIDGLRIEHCAFSNFTHAAIALTNCLNVDLRGNAFDNAHGPTVRVEDPDSIVYAGYSGYTGTGPTRTATTHGMPLLAVVQSARPGHSAFRVPHSALGTPLGPHRFTERDTSVLHVAGPFVHSTGTTSANIEWWATAPAEYTLAWGSGTNLTNRVERYAHQAASYSLNGLEPGTVYRLRITPDRPLTEVGSEKRLERLAVAFTTLDETPEPSVYHVATNGRDTATGLSPDAAWRSLAHAVDQVRPGDTVLINEGVYSESVWLRVTGEETRPITFKARPGHKVTLDGIGRSLKYAFMGADKHHLRFDGLYFTGFDQGCSHTPFILMPRRVGYSNGALILYRSDDVRITRCFLDGRGAGYACGLVIAMHCAGLEVRNCAIVNTMGGGVTIFWDSPRARVENNVFLGSLISHAGIHVWDFKIRTPEDRCTLEKNIFSDNLAKKASAPLLLTNRRGSRIRENCFFLRQPPEQRAWARDGIATIGAFLNVRDEDGALPGNIAADPRFAGDPGVPPDPRLWVGYSPDHMMKESFPLDFDFLFATQPDVANRGIGLQPEAFADFHFHRPDAVERPRPSDVVRLNASHNDSLVHRMVQDGGAWNTGTGQEAGMWVELNFTQVKPVHQLTLRCGNAFPGACELYVDRGSGYDDVPVASLVGEEGTNIIEFDDAPEARRLKIVLTEPRKGWWSIGGVTVNGRATVAF